MASIRLRRRKTVVIDATNVQETARKPLIELARRFHAVPVVIALDVPERVCHDRNKARANRAFGPHVVERHVRDLRKSLRGNQLKREGFRTIFHLDGLEQIAQASFSRVPLWTDKRNENGPFDFIGDVHGCFDELTDLLTQLGYAPDSENVWRHSENRRMVFVGDLVDRGPKVVETANLVMDAVQAGTAFCVPGNHDNKLMRALQGKNVQITHGLDKSLAQIDALPEPDRQSFRDRFANFVDKMVSHFWLDGGAVAVSHAGLKEEMVGRASGRIRDFALYGDTTGETDEFGLPVRWNWASEYRGKPTIVYGHTPVPQVEWLNNTVNLDTGCVFGGSLTALRWPEKEIVSVKARETYAEPARPFLTPPPSPPRSGEGRLSNESGVSNDVIAVSGDSSEVSVLPSPLRGGDGGGVSIQWQHDDLLDLADFTGRRVVETRLAGNVLIAAENANAALEVMSRFAAHPRWLMYLPPTMSPVETSKADGYLERPEEAFAYYAGRGVGRVVCQEKHMGSRAVLVVCRNAEAARVRFGAEPNETGAVLTRTGRPFFDDANRTQAVLDSAAQALEQAGLWDDWQTDWCALDVEIMPWNAKAQGLLKEQYAPVGTSARMALGSEIALAEAAAHRGVAGMDAIAQTLRERLADVEAYQAAYARYCWHVSEGGIADLKIAPFHVLAVEGRTFTSENHGWHIGQLGKLRDANPGLFVATETQIVDVGDADSRASGAAWWEEKTGAGGEGMVVKPWEFMPPPKTQPAVKVRGREYLRIIYGPEYTRPENLSRLRDRGLGGKRALAMKEFALGIEGLERFVKGEPLRRVHECAFGVLALESEPIDPRL